jgi:MYXO-CTERM domain-containing protein
MLVRLVLVCVSLCAWPAWALPECLPAGGTIYLCDPLDDGASVGTAQGGTFVEDGWRVDEFSDHILYDLGTDVERGVLSVYVRGLGMETLDNQTMAGHNKHHVIEFFDGTYASEIDYGTNIRLYGSLGENPAAYGTVKYQLGSWPAAEVQCPGEVWLSSFDTSIWDSTHWFHWQIEFGDGDSRCLLDGVEIATISYADCPVALRYIFVPILPDGRIDSLWGSVYSHVSFSACDDPCDDANECTADDHCEGNLCAGSPVIDGIPCDDGDPHTFHDVCLSGECLGSPDDGTDDDDDGDDDDVAGWDDDDASPGSWESGCGCRVPPGDRGGAGWIGVLAALVLAFRRR